MQPSSALLACLAALSAPPSFAQGDDSVLATYDLRAVMPRWDAGSSWSQSLLVHPVASPDQELAGVEGSLKYAETVSYELVDLLTQVLGEDARRDGRELTVDGHSLMVLGPPAVHEQVRAVLDVLAATLGTSTVVRIDVLTLPGADADLGPAGVIPEEEAERRVAELVGRGAQHRSHSLELSAGRTAVLDDHRTIPFVCDYDAEISQVISILMPVMSETRDGTRLVARAIGLPGGLALALVRVRSELLGPIATREIVFHGLVNQGEGGGTELLGGPQALQSPDVLASAFAFDTFLADGKALALRLEGSLGDTSVRELVLVRHASGALSSYASRAIPRSSRTVIALNAELFRPGRLWVAADPYVDPVQGRQPSLVAVYDGELSGFLLEWLKTRFSVWRRFGPWILVVTDPAWDRDAAAQLERLIGELRPATALHTVGIDLRGAGDGPGLVRIEAPLLAGSSAGFVLARGRTAVLGYDVEVANGAAVPDPHVGSVFEGLALALGLRGGALEARGMGQALAAGVGTFDTGYDVIGLIERPEPNLLRFDERVTLQQGPVRIGGTSARGAAGLALELTVSEALR